MISDGIQVTKGGISRASRVGAEEESTRILRQIGMAKPSNHGPYELINNWSSVLRIVQE